MHARKGGEAENLEQVLARIEQAAPGGGRVRIGDILDEVGRRSFGPILLVAGLTVLAPLIGDIPGVPTLVGLTVLLIAAQLLIGRESFWLPRWLLERGVDADRLRRALRKLRRPARFIDRFLRRRLAALTAGGMIRVVAVFCVAIALAMPPMELVPFSANAAGAALTAFGLALIAHDGVLALVAMVVTAAIIALVGWNLLG